MTSTVGFPQAMQFMQVSVPSHSDLNGSIVFQKITLYRFKNEIKHFSNGLSKEAYKSVPGIPVQEPQSTAL